MTNIFGQKSSSGLLITEKTALFNSAVFACQRGISESFAMIPRDIYQKTEKNGRKSIDNHPSIKALTTEANPLMTSFTFFRTVQHHILGSGNGYAELQFKKGTGQIVAMWPLPSDRVEPEVIINERQELDVVYHVTLPDGSKVTLPKSHVLHLPGLGYDGIRGYSVTELMANAIGLGSALEEFGALYFKQGADIAGYVEIPDTMDEAQIKNLKKHYELINGGLENAHRFKFLYESAKFKPTGGKPYESQMLESRVFQIQEVARFHRYPLHKLQELSKGQSYNSLEQFNIEFVNDTLMPWVTLWEQEINRKFFIDPKDKGMYVKFNINALLRGDSASRANFYRTMVMTGIMTVNEARAFEDLPPMDGGDNRMIPLNMSDADTDKKADARQRIQD